MCDIITLSSEDEADGPPKKRIKPTLLEELNTRVTITNVETINKKQLENEVHELLSDDDDDEVSIIHSNGENSVSTVLIEDDGSKIPTNDAMDVRGIIELDDDDNNTTHGTFELVNESSDEKSSIREESPDKENKSENITCDDANAITNDSSVPSTSFKDYNSSNSVLLEKFVCLCKNSIRDTKFQVVSDRFPLLWKNYEICESDLGESPNFKQMIQENMEKATKSTALAVISFNEIFQYLKDLVEAESIEVSSENLVKLKKLKKTIKKLMVHIKQLEESEVDFSDEENSVYMQYDRYNHRLAKVHKKYCEILNKNPYSGRLTHTKLNFVDSEYNEINRAISKKFKNNKKFPSYAEMETFIKKVVADNNLELGQAQIKSESVRCFKKLGELLQDRRKKELYDSHCMHIKNSEDPAKDNPILNSILKQSYEDGQKKIENIVQSYVVRDQQEDKAHLVKRESDESDYVDSEDEGNESGGDKSENDDDAGNDSKGVIAD